MKAEKKIKKKIHILVSAVKKSKEQMKNDGTDIAKITGLVTDKLNGINAQIDPFIRHSARPRQTSHLELQSDRIQKAQDEDFKTSSSWSSSKPHQSPSAALRHFLGALKLGMYSGCLTQSI
ncbi:hypothetical protein Zmor_018574 [Zophobas morio]|uniref:Uncharacterized protein n=1 Tax=Zophobas morio TaxID=2755281 RepID=A0AA38ICN0_9CUCU|nr:hypothetical protein Zmor_018574 [Zophobas morio]